MNTGEFCVSGEQTPLNDKAESSPTRILDLHLPEMAGKLTLDEIQVAQLAEEPRILAPRRDFPLLNLNGAPIINAEQSIDLYQRQRERFSQANIVIAECRSIGLGDAFNHLRYALLLAEKTPDKHILIAVNHHIADLACLDVPLNAHIMTGYDAELLTNPRVFVIKFQLMSLMQEHMATQQIHRETYDMFRQIEVDGRYATYHNSLAFHWEHLARVIGLDPAATDYNVAELVNIARLQLLGVAVSDADVRRPVTHIAECDAEACRYDLLIVPDAGENVWDGRSIKSLSANTWGQVIALLPRGMRIGIVRGHQHPDYTDQVVEVATRYGDAVEEIETRTLEDFCRLVGQTERYVGGDTGPTHLARDVIKAAYLKGRRIAFREIYDEGRYPLHEYGTTGSGEDGKMLVVNTKRAKAPGEIGYDSDLDRVKPQDVAAFILS
jgi:hypothetical protein